jgi:ribonuclease HI
MAKESKKALIYSDSKYSIDCISLWAYGWKKKGWKKKGGEIKNLALIQLAHSLYEEIKSKVSIKHVKGHSGVEGNELADRMAVYAIRQKSLSYMPYDYTSISDVLGLSEG